MLAAAALIAVWGLMSKSPQFYHYVLPPLATIIALARLKGWVPGQQESWGDGRSLEEIREQPAQGLERRLHQAIIGLAILLFLLSLFSGSLNWVSVVAPAGMILVATARLKGWVRLGSGGSGGGGP